MRWLPVSQLNLGKAFREPCVDQAEVELFIAVVLHHVHVVEMWSSGVNFFDT